MEEAGDPPVLHQEVVYVAAPHEQRPHSAGHASHDAGSLPGGQGATQPVGAAEQLADQDEGQTQPEVRGELDQRLRAGLAQGRGGDIRHTEGEEEHDDAPALAVRDAAARACSVEQGPDGGEQQDGIGQGQLLQHDGPLVLGIAREVGHRLRHREEQHPEAQAREWV